MQRRLPMLLIGLLISLMAFVPAIAQDDPTATPDAEMTPEMMQPEDAATYLRFAHFAPGVDGVDIYIDETPIEETNLTYPGVTGWMPVETGAYAVDVAPTGSAIGDAVISLDDVEVGPGFVTVAVILSEDGQPTPFIVTETREDLLPATSGLTLMNALSTTTPVNFDRDDVPFATELSAETTRALYTPVDSGTYTIRAYDPFAEDEGTFGSQEVELVDGSYYLVAAVGTADDAQLFVHETTGAEYALATGELEEPGTIISAVESNESLMQYADIFETAGLTETLSGEGPYTVLLPAEFLIDDINAAVGDDTELLANTLQNHVIEGSIPLNEITDMESVTTLAGNTYDITIEGNNVFIGDAQVLTTNIFATNGVIHIIDGILTLPESGG